jgi:hypothetical protein
MFLRKEDLKYRAACEEKLRAVNGIFAEQRIDCSTLCLESWKPVTLEVLDLTDSTRATDPFLIIPTEAGQ